MGTCAPTGKRGNTVVRSRAIFCIIVASLFLLPVSSKAETESGLRRLPPVEIPSAQLIPSDVPERNGADVEAASAVGQEEIAAGEAEVATEQEYPTEWYQWVVPTYWRMPKTWESSFELGIDGSEGNARTLAFRSGANLRRKVDWSDLTVDINYMKASADTIETKHNAQLEANHDWLLGDSPWTLFGKTILVYDEFRPFDLELTLNTGVGYQFIDTCIWNLKGRFGSGATRQWDGPDHRWRPEAMLGVDFEFRISDRQKLRATSEYYPEWGEFNIYRIRTDAGWEMLLDEATNMSLKLGVIDRYDSNPGDAKPNALDYSVLLLWKL